MSSRKSSFSGEGLPPGRCVERTPLRSVQNEMHLSTPLSRFKSLLGADEKPTKTDVPLCNPEAHSQSPPTTKVNQFNAVEACGLGDVTFKSVICPGGEVEVPGFLVCAEESIVLPKDQAINYMHEMEDTLISDRIIVQSCSDHNEHPYYNPEMKDASLVDIDAACLGEISNATLASGDLDVRRVTHDFRAFPNDYCGKKDVTWKSFVCDGGEVEVFDVTRLQDETIPLPKARLVEPQQENSVNVTYLSDCSQLSQAEHADHPYFSSENAVCAFTTFSETTNGSEKPPGGLSDVTFKSLNCTGGVIEISGGTKLADEIVPLPADQTATCSESYNYGTDPSMLASDQDWKNSNDHLDHHYCKMENDPLGEPLSFSLDVEEEVKQIRLVGPDSQTGRQEGITFSSFSSARSDVEIADGLSQTTSPVPDEQAVICQLLDDNTQVQISSESNEAMDSALGLTGSETDLCNSAETPQAEHLPDVLKVLSECPSVASAIQFGILSPVVRRASLAFLKAFRAPTLDKYALEGEKSALTPFNVDPAVLWAEHLESPMPRPLFNSTALGCNTQSETVGDVVAKPCAVPHPEVEKPVLDIPFNPDGPLQQQLLQMAEFLFLASGKMAPAAVCAPVLPPAAVMVPSAKATSAESHSVCVGTTPVKWVDHSVNTSGQFERKRDISVVDSCTLTNPLLWNLPPGSLECLPRPELEQRLRSSMIMVEALVQQLDASRAKGCPSAGPAPSDLREKQVQTDHSELSQTTMYRDLYFEALSRIGELELNESSLQNLIQRMQDIRGTMTSLSYDTDAALSTIKQIGAVVREDHESLVLHYGQMKSVFEKTKETHTTLMQKVKDAFHQRDDMRKQMEDAFTAKEAAFSVIEQLRTHCATEIIELERMVGSHQELSAALDQTYPEQVALNQAYTGILNSASDVLAITMDEQCTLMKELRTVRALLQKTAPMLLQLNEKAASALSERDEHLAARDQAEEEREQIEEEFKEANMNLQTATEQISDLNLQVTILNSEMGVLRQKLTEREEERGQLEMKVTQLSATVSSTLASSTFLEQALAAQNTKLQQSWKDIQITTDRANDLEKSLGHSEQRASEFSQVLAQREEQLSQLQVLSRSQQTQIQQLQDVCTQLNSVRETNEFLQVENEFAREQMAESEHMVRANLQGLRERNIQCEDLKAECGQLQLENRSLQEELETTRSRADATQLELGQKLAQAVTEITLLHHTLRGLTNGLQTALNDQKSEPQKESQRRHPSSSFVDSIMVALTAEKEEDVATDAAPGSDSPGPPCENVFSATSAFTRIATPKKNLNSVEFNPGEDEQSSAAELLADLLADLGGTVSELTSTVKLMQQRKDAQLEELHNTISGLQVEQQAAKNRHEAEVFELKHQLSSLSSMFERGNQALQQRAQDEKTVTKLMAEIQETQEILNKHKIDSNGSRKELVELRRSLHQSKVEIQFLHEELGKAGSQSANPALFMEEKIQLLREMERLKLSLQEAEQARVKLLDRAKRHQIIHQTNQQKSENELQMLNKILIKVRETLLSLPVVVKNCVQLQQLIEYIG